MTSHIDWLRDELPGLQRAGVLDATAAERLRTHYEAASPAARRNWAALVISVIGALLLGGGVILLIAHNWEALPKAVRLAVAVGPLLVAQVLAWPALGAKARTRPGYAEAVGGIWALVLGAAIAIVSQIYHLGGDTETFLLVWAMGVLPIVYLLDSTLAAWVALGLITGWAGVATESGRAVGYWLWLLPLAPWLGQAWRRVGTSMRAAWAIWGLAASLLVGLGCSLDRSLPGLWIVAYSGLLATLIGCDTRRDPAAVSWARRPLAVAGGLGLIVLAMLFTFAWPWREIGWYHYRWERAEGIWPWLDAAIAVGWAAAGLAFALKSAQRGAWLRAAYLTFPLLATVAYGLSSVLGDHMVAAVLFNGWLFVVGLATALAGARSARLTLLNGGLLAAGGVVVARFFDSDMDLLARGIAFVLLGAGLLGSNLYVMRRKGGRS